MPLPYKIATQLMQLHKNSKNAPIVRESIMKRRRE